jgi:hypothetical protein
MPQDHNIILEQLASVKERISGDSAQDAMAWSKHMLKAETQQVRGIRDTCIVQWSFDDSSMWRGPPDNARIVKIAKSIICSKFRRDSVIASRTLDMSKAVDAEDDLIIGRLLFGDGSARGVAAMIVWVLILKNIDSLSVDNTMEDLVMSILRIPTNFEEHGDGSAKANLVAQAARQNQLAQVLPVNTLEWLSMTVQFHGIDIGTLRPTKENRALIVSNLEAMLSAYNQLPDVDAYSSEPPTKKARVRKNTVAHKILDEPDEGQDKGLKIGVRRVTAMKNFLEGGTFAGLSMLREHLMWVSDYKYCVVNDELMMKKWLWVGSHLPKTDLPSDADLSKADASAGSSNAVPKGRSFELFNYDSPLSAQQFELMLKKAISVYEAETGHLERDEHKVKLRPSEENSYLPNRRGVGRETKEIWMTREEGGEGHTTHQAFSEHLRPKETWMNYRKIIQAWDLTMAKVAEKDMSKADFDLLEDAVLRGNMVDDEVLQMLKRRPRIFHLSMLPACHIETKDETAQEITKAHSEAAAAKLKLFEAELRSDWVAIEETEIAKAQLGELLHWLELEHRRAQTALAQDLVAKRLSSSHPILTIESWDKLPSQLSLMCRAWDTDLKEGVRRAIIWIDFNTPRSRDTLKMPAMLSAMANLCRMLGPERAVMFIWLPACAKDESSKGPDEDEVDIVNLLKKCGFLVQKRVRMLLSVHPSVINKVSEMDLFADGRLAMLAKDPKDAKTWWPQTSEMFRTGRISEQPQLPQSKDLVHLTSMDADTDVNQDARPPDVAAKCAQRGPAVALAQLSAIIPKGIFQPKDELLVVDVMPYVGDRALASYNYTKSQSAEGQGRIRHVLVQLQTKDRADKAATFTERRLANVITKEWLSRTVILKDTVTDWRGETEEPVYPNDAVPAPTDEQLRSIQGGVAAYKGLAALELKACYLRGSRVKIQPAKLAQFEGAPLDVQDQLEILSTEHEKTYETKLAAMDEAKEVPDRSDTKDDARTPDIAGTQPPAELVTYAIEEELRAKVTISHSAKAVDKSITLFKDAKESYYLVSAKERVLNMGTHLGGIGGGSLLAEDPEAKRCWPWALPDGDKTWVQLNRPAAEGEDAAKTAPKVSSGTLYALSREIEANSTGPPKLTSFGNLIPSGTPGRHEYRFEFPRDHERHEKLSFVVMPGPMRKKGLITSRMMYHHSLPHSPTYPIHALTYIHRCATCMRVGQVPPRTRCRRPTSSPGRSP